MKIGSQGSDQVGDAEEGAALLREDRKARVAVHVLSVGPVGAQHTWHAPRVQHLPQWKTGQQRD